MKIRRLEIQGYKSFPDRTVFDFGDGITAVVGPNGCGKSNVVDAVKWVLGDMSPKSQRGRKMDDVIFTGAAGRKAAHMAEVTLVLDNSDGRLPTEHAEVSVTRRLYRSGESEYLVNGADGRLKDVRELFFDTGLGIEGQSIMEQGQIDALLRANAVDRRGLFEEAAGVSRYKQRKKEAEARLEKTKENLERLRDVLDLEEKRLRSLKTQASRARRYKELGEELRRARVTAAVLRWRAATQERAALEASVDDVRRREEAVAADLAALEGESARCTQEREAAVGRVHELEGQIARAQGDARAAQDRAAWALRTAEDLRVRAAAAERAAGEASSRAEAIEPDAAAADAEAAAERDRVAGLDAAVAQVEGELAAIAREAEAVRKAHEGAKRAVLELLHAVSRARNEETERRTESRQADARLARVAEQDAEVAQRLEKVEAEAHELSTAAARLARESEAAAQALAEAEAARGRHAEEAEAAELRRAHLAEERAKRAERLDVLRRLSASFEGVEGGARLVLEEAARREGGDGVVGLLAELAEVPTKGAHQVDRLLGLSAGAVVVRTTADALRWLAWLRGRGGARARLLPLDLARADAPPLPPEVGEVRGSPEVLSLLRSVAAGCVLVPDLPSAVAAWRASPAGANAVTPEGDRVTASGALVTGAGTAALGLVERAAEVRRLSDEVRSLGADLEAARTASEAARAATREADEQVRRVRQDIARRLEDRSRQGAALARAEKERGHLRDQREAAESERAELLRVREASEAGAAKAAEAASAIEVERAGAEARADEAMAAYAELEARGKVVAERRMEAKLAAADARARADAAGARAARLRRDAAALRERAEASRGEAQALRVRIAENEAEAAQAQALLRDRESESRRDAGLLLDARRGLEALDRGLSSSRTRSQEVRAEHERLRGELDEFRRKEAEHRVRVETLVEAARAEYGVELEQASAEATPEEAAAEPAALDAHAAELRAKIEELGNVNLNAIVELEEADQRVGFLKAQEKDLVDAKAGLEAAIVQLDELSVTRFQETFSSVREHFRETFRRLFGGGRAELVLENPSDVLESGIDIMARPPGKEQRTIGLLSGGERALTAVALLFAVFCAKPSPFAILDEVDAALDEANTRRLNAMLKEFTTQTQFIVVTHAKTTMESADALYGVTMEEPGVSKKVGVRLDETAEAVAS